MPIDTSALGPLLGIGIATVVSESANGSENGSENGIVNGSAPGIGIGIEIEIELATEIAISSVAMRGEHVRPHHALHLLTIEDGGQDPHMVVETEGIIELPLDGLPLGHQPVVARIVHARDPQVDEVLTATNPIDELLLPESLGSPRP